MTGKKSNKMDHDEKEEIIEMTDNNNKAKENDSKKRFDVNSWLSIIISFVALGVSFYSYIGSRQTTLLVSSEEYKISNNLKSHVLDLQSVLDRINRKITYSTDTVDKLDITEEIKFLSNLQMGSGDKIIRLLVNKDDQIVFDRDMYILMHKTDSLSKKQLLTMVREMARIVNDEQFIKAVESFRPKENILSRIKEMEKFDDSVPYFPPYSMGDIHYYSDFYEYKVFDYFVYQMVIQKHVKDPDLILLAGVIMKDPVMIDQAIEAGANVNVTVKEIKERYHDEYKKLLKKPTSRLTK